MGGAGRSAEGTSEGGVPSNFGCESRPHMEALARAGLACCPAEGCSGAQQARPALALSGRATSLASGTSAKEGD